MTPTTPKKEIEMRYRKRMSSKGSKRYFRKASRVKRINGRVRPMRGGYRL